MLVKGDLAWFVFEWNKTSFQRDQLNGNDVLCGYCSQFPWAGQQRVGTKNWQHNQGIMLKFCESLARATTFYLLISRDISKFKTFNNVWKGTFACDNVSSSLLIAAPTACLTIMFIFSSRVFGPGLITCEHHTPGNRSPKTIETMIEDELFS